MIHRPRYPGITASILSFALGVTLTALVAWRHGPVDRVVPEQAVAERRIVEPADPPMRPQVPEGTTGKALSVPAELSRRRLSVPVDGIARDSLVASFDQERSGGRKHEAIDILAPRNTPVVAVEDGVIARLFTSAQGGLTIYQLDPTREYVYYYAHLERYAENLNEGDRIRQGDVIGYVGTTGNAPQDTPHLHFAIFRMTDEKRWWDGTPIDPYGILRKTR